MIAREIQTISSDHYLTARDPLGLQCLSILQNSGDSSKHDPSRLGKIKQAFENPGQFFPTVGELVIYAHFRSLYDRTEIEHNVEERPAKRPVNCKVEIDGIKILLKIASFEPPAPLKYGTILANVPNRAKGRLVKDKLKTQIPASTISRLARCRYLWSLIQQEEWTYMIKICRIYFMALYSLALCSMNPRKVTGFIVDIAKIRLTKYQTAN